MEELCLVCAWCYWKIRAGCADSKRRNLQQPIHIDIQWANIPIDTHAISVDEMDQRLPDRRRRGGVFGDNHQAKLARPADWLDPMQSRGEALNILVFSNA